MNGNTTGQNNIALGRSAGDVTTTGSNNITIGYGADPTGATESNEITLGNSSNDTLRCQVTSITSLSDERDKTDIIDLPLGIDFLNTIRPVKFTWKHREPVPSKDGTQKAGFIAQELDKAQKDAGVKDYMQLVLDNNPDKLEASVGHLLPVLVKAVQELSAEVEQLKSQINN